MLDALQSKSNGLNKQRYSKLLTTLYALSRIDIIKYPKKHKFIKLFISLFPYLYPKLSKWFWNKNGGEEYQYKSLHSVNHINARTMLDDILHNVRFNNLLEVGCGTGDNLVYLKTIFNKDFTGCDFSEEQIKVARKDIRIKFDLANACSLPYKDKQFDIVITVGCLVHIPKSQIKQAASEIQRVCRNYLIIQEEDTEFMCQGLETLEGKSGFHFYHDYNKLFTKFKPLYVNKDFNHEIYLHLHLFERIVC